MWKCDECGEITDTLTISWGMSGGHKVDVLDYFCPRCPSNDLTFQGTDNEKEDWWDKEWAK